jgi:hypothetical protein
MVAFGDIPSRSSWSYRPPAMGWQQWQRLEYFYFGALFLMSSMSPKPSSIQAARAVSTTDFVIPAL